MANFTSVFLLLGTILAWAIIRLLGNLFAPGVRNIPGPVLAKFTNLYRLYSVSKGDNHISLASLHRKYGDNVRLGPHVISICNSEDISKVYGIKGGFVKSNFYAVQQQLANGAATKTLFTSLDEGFHSRIKRPVASAYSMTTLTDYEPLVDRSIRTLFRQLDHRYESKGLRCPIFEWLQYYAFDVIGELTCSHPFGFVEGARDVGGIIDALNKSMDYNAIIGQLPWLDHWLKKNPIWTWLAQPTGPVARFSQERLLERLGGETEKSPVAGGQSRTTTDFVDRFLAAKETHPDVVDDKQVLSYMITNIFAGSDTTAISLRAILYYTMKDPVVYGNLMRELDDAHATGRLSMPITWKESQKLPYFDAVVKEALRLHPAVGLILERLVPKDGLRLASGRVLPEGTIVGASPWVIHRDPIVFGEDVHTFRPERWLRGDSELAGDFEERLQNMTRATMTFGKGTRTCIGKNISLLEIYKMLPSFFLTYSVEQADPGQSWKVKNSWFVRQEGVDVYLHRRA